jgi:hypothetical protein
MLRKTGLLLVFMLYLGYAFAATKTKEKVCGSDCPAQAAQPDKRGTSDSPLVVDARSIHSDEEAAEEAKRIAEQKRINTWNIRLTFVIAVCAFLQFCAIVGQIVVYCGQSKMMVKGLRIGIKSARAAKQNANAAILGLEMMMSKERARVSIEIKSLSLRMLSPSIIYKVISHGPTHAIVEKAWVITSLAPMFSIEWGDDETSYHRQIEIPNVFPESEIESEDFIFNLTPEIATGIESGDWFVHFRARVIYKDLFGKPHETAIYKIYGQATNPIYRLSGPKWVLAESGNWAT